MNLFELRRNYANVGLNECDVAPDPFAQFDLWFTQAMEAGVCEPNAMTLATVNASAEPQARTVLLKGYDSRGFVFYSNYGSAKGRELAGNPRVALLFYWCDLERQIRIHGSVGKTSPEESDAYFNARPEASKISALCSAQSEVVPNREVLERAYHDVAQRFARAPVPRPPHWGGYRVLPASFEFWQGRPSRLHDRIRYRQEEGIWRIDRLSP